MPSNNRPSLLPLLFLAGAYILPVQSAQAGLLEALFGLEDNEPQVSVMPTMPRRHVHTHRQNAKKKKHAIVRAAPKPVIVQALTGEAMTDLLHDVTLKRGDAVMTPDGLRIFMGDPEGLHETSDFQPLAILTGRKANHKKLLAAIDSARAKPIPLPRHEEEDGMSTGRSIALNLSEPIPASLEDPSRPFIRYVGP